MKFKIIIAILCMAYNTAFSQNLIRNGNFETGVKSGSCITGSSFSEFAADYWNVALEHPSGCGGPLQNDCPTPDWITNGCVSTFNQRLPPTTPSVFKCVGLGRGYQSFDWIEGVRTELSEPLVPGHLYELTIKMAVSDSNSAVYPGYDFYRATKYDNKLKISFATWGEHWNSSSSGHVLWENITDAFIIPANSPHDWYTITYKFRCPSDIGGTSTSQKLKNLIIRTHSDNVEWTSYIFIDDVSLMHVDPCRSMCTPDSANAHIVCPAPPQASFPIANVYTYNGTAYFQSYKVTCRYATQVEFTIRDTWGSTIYKEDYYDPNILKSPFNDTLFVAEWGGTYQDGSAVPEDDYWFILRMWNCYEFVEKSGSFTWFYHPDNVHHIPDSFDVHVDTLQNCCPDYYYGNHVTYTGSEIHAVNKRIIAGDIGDAIVENGAKVYYSAGQDITLGKYFTVKSGGEFTAKIHPCQAAPKELNKTSPFHNDPLRPKVLIPLDSVHLEKLREIEKRKGVNGKLPEFKVSPNPFSDFIHLYSEEPCTYTIFDVLGRLVAKDRISIDATVNTSALSDGTYFLYMQTAEGYSKTFKLIKITK